MKQNERKLYKRLKDAGAIPDPHDRIENVYEPGHPDIEFCGIGGQVGFLELKYSTAKSIVDVVPNAWKLFEPSQIAWLAKWEMTGGRRDIFRPPYWLIIGGKTQIVLCKCKGWIHLIPSFTVRLIIPSTLPDLYAGAIHSILFSNGQFKEGP